MNEFETVVHLMALSHVTYKELSKRMGSSNEGNLYNSLNKSKNIYVKSLLKILDAMEYDLVIRSRDGSNAEYIIRDDQEVSPLRFRGMNIDLEKMFKQKSGRSSTNVIYTRGEAIAATQSLKKRTGELTFYECDKELRKIWNIKEHIRGKRKPENEFLEDYQNYLQEFVEIYKER